MLTQVQELGQAAKAASRVLSAASAQAKNQSLLVLAELLRTEQAMVLAANAKDCQLAKEQGMDAARLDRLTLTPTIMQEMSEACKQVADMPDPIGALDKQWQQPNGLLVGKMRIPLGVVAMIYESRPNVTIEAAILCLKAGNAVILRGGSEAVQSNGALANLLKQALSAAKLPLTCAQVLQNTDRAVVTALCQLDEYIDVIIPRGGEALVRLVCTQATMPVLKHYKGVCHCFIDAEADLEQAVEIIYNSKVQRPAACNSLECLLVHTQCAAKILPLVAKCLGQEVSFRACPEALPYLGTADLLQVADLGQEFQDYILAVVVVKDLDAALDHIAKYGSNHSEIICTNNYAHATRFMREADASMVGVNASTRFNDGGQLGLGAEIGISTSKLHAYGPMGLQELTTTKFVVQGCGQVRA